VGVAFEPHNFDQAEREKTALISFLNACILDPVMPDKRVWRMNTTQTFSVRNICTLCNWGGVEHVSASCIWKYEAPKKARFFLGLW
jgi:hypothetical protein